MSQREKNSNTGTHVSELWCAAREAPMGKREAGTEAPAGSGEQALWERGAGVCCLLGGGDLRGLREELTEESEFGGPGRASVGTQIADGGSGGSPVDTERRCSRRLTRLAARDILDRVRLVTACGFPGAGALPAGATSLSRPFSAPPFTSRSVIPALCWALTCPWVLQRVACVALPQR